MLKTQKQGQAGSKFSHFKNIITKVQETQKQGNKKRPTAAHGIVKCSPDGH